MAKKSTLEWITFVLVIVGGINWGLYAFGVNLVSILFGWSTAVENIIYILVGLSALYMLYYAMKK